MQIILKSVKNKKTEQVKAISLYLSKLFLTVQSNVSENRESQFVCAERTRRDTQICSLHFTDEKAKWLPQTEHGQSCWQHPVFYFSPMTQVRLLCSDAGQCKVLTE